MKRRFWHRPPPPPPARPSRPGETRYLSEAQWTALMHVLRDQLRTPPHTLAPWQDWIAVKVNAAYVRGRLDGPLTLLPDEWRYLEETTRLRLG